MRTEPSSPWTSAYAGLRTWAGRARRWLAGRGTVTRVALLLVALAGLGGVGYFASLDDPAEHAPAWLFEGQKLSTDQLTAMGNVLDAAGIPYIKEGSPGRVGVKADRKGDALAALAKNHAIPPTLDDLARADPADNPLFSGPGEIAKRDHDNLERALKHQIEGLSGVASAHVRINRVKNSRSPYAAANVSAYVYLRTEGGRGLGRQAVDGIETFLLGAVPELKPESITVADQEGKRYLSAGNPGVKEQMQTHAREEDWRDKIAMELRHIPDVGVSVLLEQVPAPVVPPEPLPPSSEVLVRPNGSIRIEPTLPPPALPPAPPLTKARVLVRVPRSFYLTSSRYIKGSPSEDDLKEMTRTTERIIRDAVEIHIPRDLLGEVKVDTIQDDLANASPPKIPPDADARRVWLWPAIIGGIGLAGTMALVATTLRIATRRPSARESTSPWRPGFVAEGASGPAPGHSGRVREFVRLNPDAAAGVLQRWIGQPHPSPGPSVGDPASAAREPLPPLRKAAILVVSLEQPLASGLLAQLDRPAVEAVTLEIAHLERIAAEEQQAVLEEFYGLGLRRLRFVFEDLLKMDDTDLREAYHVEDAATWALALVGAARPVRAKVLGALDSAAGDDLRRRLALIGSYRLDDAEAAQADLADRLRRLHDHGQLTLPDPNGQEAILV